MVIGRVVRAHALAGGVRVKPDGATAGSLTPGDSLRVVLRDGVARELTVAARTGDGASPILRFEEITDRDGAEALRGALISVADDAVAGTADADTFLVRDLIGCDVYLGDERLGPIVEVHSGTANDNIEVERDGRNMLLPFTRDAVADLQIARRRLTIRADLLPGGAPDAD